MSVSAKAFDAFWLRLLAIIWQHRDKLDDLVDLVSQITAALAAKDYPTAFKAIYELGVLLLSMITAPSAQGVQAFADESKALADFEANHIGDGVLLRKLRDFLNSPEGQLLVELIRKWFGL